MTTQARLVGARSFQSSVWRHPASRYYASRTASSLASALRVSPGAQMRVGFEVPASG